METIKRSQMPKQSPDMQLSLAAHISGDLDAVAAIFKARPYRYKIGQPGSVSEYRCIYFRLSGGSFARIGEEEGKKGELEIELMLEGWRFFYEEDLNEIAATLGVEVTKVRRWRGREIWRMARQP